jgi:hypothetical protein
MSLYYGCAMRGADSTISTPTEAEDGARPCIAARVVAHPEAVRVGDFVPLFDVSGGGTVAIHRLSPEFRAHDGRRALPLKSRRVTRTPLHLTRQGGDVRVRFEGASPAVQVNGEPLVGERMLSAEDLAAGAIVQFGKYVVLWRGQEVQTGAKRKGGSRQFTFWILCPERHRRRRRWT